MKRLLLAVLTLTLFWPGVVSAAWKDATLLAPQQKMDDGRVQIVVQLSGDAGELSGKIVLYSTDGDFKTQIKAQIATLNKNTASTSTLPTAGAKFDLTDAAVVTTPEDAQRQRFQRDVLLATVLKAYIDLGVTAAQADFDAIVAEANKLYVTPQGVPTP